MPPRRRTSPSDRLQEQIESGDTYGALQTARALFARLEGQGKGAEARTTILNVARLFAEKGELKSVVDLAKLYMTNNSQKTGVSEAMETDNSFSEHGYIRGGRDNILALSTCLPASPEKVSVLSSLAKWGLEELKQPDSEVCMELAEAHREVKNFASAVHRLGQAGVGGAPAYVGVLREWVETGYRSEADLFVCRAILSMLSKGDLAYASALYSGVKGDPSLSVRVEESPLFHLVGIVLDLIQVRDNPQSQQAFRLLTDFYSKTLDRDPELGSALTKIGQGFFGIMPPQNPFASLLSSMLGGGMPQLAT